MTTEKEVSTLKLIKGNIQKTEELDKAEDSSKFARRMVHNKDEKTANEMIRQQATHEADQIFGDELTQLRMEAHDLDAQSASSNVILADLEARLANTCRYIKTAKPTKDDGFKNLL
ncbi:MAG: hypothetical protein NMNS01_11970 [Nitrosomonas sp.]|nr:MAG: hypothetical protein NMNS01_11970 [Nitrosomonas sp.]